MLTLYVATTNPGKLRDYAAAALPHNIAIAPLPGLDRMPEPVEDAPTFTGNADRKALAYAALAPGLLVLADDAGLEVDALGGRPGVLSARFAESLNFEPHNGGSSTAKPSPNLPQRSKDERNNRCVLSLLADLETLTGKPPSRAARFVCALSVAQASASQAAQVLHRAEGTVAGDLLHAPRGTGGFGYDALFALRPTPHTPAQTLAELTPAAKWPLSHRGNAFRALLQQLT